MLTVLTPDQRGIFRTGPRPLSSGTKALPIPDRVVGDATMKKEVPGPTMTQTLWGNTSSYRGCRYIEGTIISRIVTEGRL